MVVVFYFKDHNIAVVETEGVYENDSEYLYLEQEAKMSVMKRDLQAINIFREGSYEC